MSVMMDGAMNSVPVPRNARTARALLFAGIGVSLSALGHAATAGHSVPLSALVLAFAATGSVAWALADRQRGFSAIGGGLAVMQAVLHLWFGVASISSEHDSSHGAAAESPVVHGGPGTMVAAHAAAAMVCAVWLWRGEVVLFALLAALYARTLAPLLLVLVHSSVDSNPRIPVQIDHRTAIPRAGVLRHVMARRGPPVAAVRF
ncbi:hypothetical protein OHB12_16505 [Nocardia sp. NBC_01730]|uniref:hypothetical protein n=1 Tax=Nocardia sp. NBC_01730 TaxID=2975998 RepID=UPI002E152EF2|nr:hypothetical protein OHB12_16505 [Nocardia sp. NBC_01730]